MRQKQSSLWALALYAMLVAALLLLAVFGAKLYAGLTASRRANERQRAALAYLQSRVAAADAAGAVSLGEGPEGQSLVLRMGDTGYETRIYLYEGSLVEEDVLTGSAGDPAEAQPIDECTQFSLAWEADGVLKITADEGSALAALRSAGGAA